MLVGAARKGATTSGPDLGRGTLPGWAAARQSTGQDSPQSSLQGDSTPRSYPGSSEGLRANPQAESSTSREVERPASSRADIPTSAAEVIPKTLGENTHSTACPFIPGPQTGPGLKGRPGGRRSTRNSAGHRHHRRDQKGVAPRHDTPHHWWEAWPALRRGRIERARSAGPMGEPGGRTARVCPGVRQSTPELSQVQRAICPLSTRIAGLARKSVSEGS